MVDKSTVLSGRGSEVAKDITDVKFSWERRAMEGASTIRLEWPAIYTIQDIDQRSINRWKSLVKQGFAH